ncbi:MAG: response regulator [Planctomycetota bacterium]
MNPRTDVRVLVAEDDDLARKTVQMYLDVLGCHATVTTNGREALGALESAPADAPFDLLVTDIDMPQMNGLDLVRHCNRERPGLPVIVMTGMGDKALVVELLRAGVSDYIDKPFTREQFVGAVRKMLTGSAAGDAGAELRRLKEEMLAVVESRVEAQTDQVLEWIRGGVKHRFNQPLTVLHANLSMLRRIAVADGDGADGPAAARAAELLPEILESLENATVCISGLVTLLGRLHTARFESYAGADQVLDFEASARH